MDKKVRKKGRKHKNAKFYTKSLEVSLLISQIYRYDLQEWKGNLNGDGRQHRKLLLDKYQSIKKNRILAGLETPDLIHFDAEAHEIYLKQQKNTSSPLKANLSRTKSLLPDLPTIEDIPSPDILKRIGLPLYQICLNYDEESIFE